MLNAQQLETAGTLAKSQFAIDVEIWLVRCLVTRDLIGIAGVVRRKPVDQCLSRRLVWNGERALAAGRGA
jgi:hypothetical protein